MTLRIAVDFNTMTVDEKERVYINTVLQPTLIEQLHPGLHVVLYDEEMEVEATLEFDEQQHVWLGCPIWSTQQDIPYS
jgi:hypothetical protein